MEYNVYFRIIPQELIQSSNIIINSTRDKDINTVKDPRLGEVKKELCQLCKETKTSGCNGHFGKLDLKNYILIRPAFCNKIIYVLKHVCYFCSSVKNNELNVIAKKYSETDDKKEKHRLKYEFNKLLETKNNMCSNINCRIITNGFKLLKDFKIQLKYTTQKEKNIPTECSIEKIYSIFESLYKPFVQLLTNSENYDTNLGDLFEHDFMYIPSNYIRESNFFTNPTTQDLTSTNILTSNLNTLVNYVKNENKKNEAQALLFKMDNSNFVDPYKKNNKMVTLADQVSGTNKDGIIRSSILSKRLDNSGRAVLGPSTDQDIGIVYLPEILANNLTESIYYNRVTKTLIDDLINKGKNPYNFKIFKIIITRTPESPIPSKVMFVKENAKLELITKLKFGSVIAVKLYNDSLIMFARQPSLHKWNLQGSKVIISPHNNFKIPIAIQASQNGDNDGDTNAIYVPTNPSSKIELTCLINSKIICKNPANNSLVFGLVQDQIICLHLLHKMSIITEEDTLALLGKFGYLIKDSEKKYYSGVEILSLFIDDFITYPNYFNNGKLELNRDITVSLVSPQSYISIFNIYSQLTNNYKALELLNSYQYLAQQYMKVFGYSVKASEVLGFENKFGENKKFVDNLVNKVNCKINEFINDVENDIINSNSRNDLIYIKEQNINVLESIILNKIEDEMKTFNTSLQKMTDCGYKRSKNEILKSNYLLGQQGEIEFLKINGKNNIYSLPGYFGLEESGYVTNSFIYGLTYPQYAVHVMKNTAPKIINVTCGTTDAGVLGKKIVKFMSDVIVNHEKGLSELDIPIIQNANFLRISGEDIVRVKILYPDNNPETFWDELQLQIFNKIKKYLIYNNRSQVIKEFIFYINIEGEIATFNNKYQYDEIKPEDGLKHLNVIFKDIERYYFDTLDLNFVYYILLSYLNPKRIKLSSELLNHIHEEIIYKINYSLSDGVPIGSEYGNSIQESCTQQTLSSIHTVTKAGQVVTEDALSRLKENVSLSMKNKLSLITVKSQDRKLLENYIYVYEYASLKQFSPKIEIIKTENYYVELKITIRRNVLELKSIKINQFVKLFDLVLSNSNLIIDYWIFPQIDEEYIHLYIGTNIISNQNDNTFNMNLHLLMTELLNNVSKGKSKNQDLLIVKTKFIDDNLEEKEIYQLSFYVNELKDLLYVDTDNVIIDIGVWNSYLMAGVFYSKLLLLDRFLDISSSEMFNPFYLLASLICIGKKPISIYHFKNKKKTIIKNIVIGDSMGFVNAAFSNQVEECRDNYADIFFHNKPKFGTLYHRFYLDLNKFANMEYEKDVFKPLDKIESDQDVF